ncbi:hypothetical protein CC78DRAFT_576527 [Lojkania enalia]|uniref:Uncharacterized protein n=1 Tax=Lojkania enalia TaxID=147567 RepID=A0A9P4KJ43_9PLEO|nr:hypothetical protein CC78DRAFT_576527 [Didymosphaeria enalia]
MRRPNCGSQQNLQTAISEQRALGCSWEWRPLAHGITGICNVITRSTNSATTGRRACWLSLVAGEPQSAKLDAALIVVVSHSGGAGCICLALRCLVAGEQTIPEQNNKAAGWLGVVAALPARCRWERATVRMEGQDQPVRQSLVAHAMLCHAKPCPRLSLEAIPAAAPRRHGANLPPLLCCEGEGEVLGGREGFRRRKATEAAARLGRRPIGVEGAVEPGSGVVGRGENGTDAARCSIMGASSWSARRAGAIGKDRGDSSSSSSELHCTALAASSFGQQQKQRKHSGGRGSRGLGEQPASSICDAATRGVIHTE